MTAPFWSNLDKYAGDVSIKALEEAAGVGKDTLRKQRIAGTAPTLEIALKVARHLSVAPATLLGEDAPLELAGADPASRRIAFLRLTASPLNPRRAIDPEALAELADSIAVNGLLQNLVVRQDADQPAIMWVVAGERRFRALELLARQNRMPADITENGVPCRVVQADDAEHTMLALLENMQRQDVNPMDEAEAIARLHDANPEAWGTRRIAEGLGVTQRHVQLRLALAHKLTPEAKADLRSGKITLAAARVLITQSSEQQLELIAPMPGGRKPTAEEMSRDIAEGAFLADYALFNIAESGLEITEIDGERYILDAERAEELQREAIGAHSDALLRDGAAFVDIVEGWFNGFGFDEGGTGVVIQIEYDGEVFIHTGLARKAVVKPGAASGRSEAAGRKYEAERRYIAEHNAAAAALRADILATLTFYEAVNLVLWDSLVPWPQRVLGGHGQMNELGKQAALRDAIAAPSVQNNTQASAAWLKLRGERDDDKRRAFTESVASRLLNPVAGKPLSPVLEFLTEGAVAPGAILYDNEKQRAGRIADWAEEDPRQTDIEDALETAA